MPLSGWSRCLPLHRQPPAIWWTTCRRLRHLGPSRSVVSPDPARSAGCARSRCANITTLHIDCLLIYQCDRIQPCHACCAHGYPSKCVYDSTPDGDLRPISQAEAIRKLRAEIRELRSQIGQGRYLMYLQDPSLMPVDRPSDTPAPSKSRTSAAEHSYRAAQRRPPHRYGDSVPCTRWAVGGNRRWVCSVTIRLALILPSVR